MDILIKNMNLVKNMEMPEGCASCPLLNCYSLCPFLIKYVNTIDYRIKRLPNCPLREIDIIYCKDCKHFIREDREEYTPHGFYDTYFDAFCDKHYDNEQGEYINVKFDDFCSFAERKEQDG